MSHTSASLCLLLAAHLQMWFQHSQLGNQTPSRPPVGTVKWLTFYRDGMIFGLWSSALSPASFLFLCSCLYPKGAGPAGCIAQASLLAAVQFLWAFERHLWTGGQGKEKPDNGFSASLLSGAPLWLQLLSGVPSLCVCPPDCSLSLLSGQRQPSGCQTTLDCLLSPGHRLLNAVPTSVISSQNDTASSVATQCDSFP